MTPTADIQLSNAGTDCASAVDGRMGALAKATAARALSAIRALRGPAVSTDGASDDGADDIAARWASRSA